MKINEEAWKRLVSDLARRTADAEEGERIWRRIRAEPRVEAEYRPATKEGIENRASFCAGEAKAYRRVLAELNKLMEREASQGHKLPKV